MRKPQSRGLTLAHGVAEVRRGTLITGEALVPRVANGLSSHWVTRAIQAARPLTLTDWGGALKHRDTSLLCKWRLNTFHACATIPPPPQATRLMEHSVQNINGRPTYPGSWHRGIQGHNGRTVGPQSPPYRHRYPYGGPPGTCGPSCPWGCSRNLGKQDSRRPATLNAWPAEGDTIQAPLPL